VTSKKPVNKLPWWVELLFVQVGLPEAWLRDLLKKKKRISLIIANNKKPLIYTLIGFGALIYINPIIESNIERNRCINAATKVLAVANLKKDLNKDKIRVFAYNYCNGGDLRLID